MKKTIIAALAASVFATGAAQATGFNGAYVGFDGGYSTLKIKDRTPDLEGANGNFGVQLGYGATISKSLYLNFYLGGEVGLRDSIGKFGDETVDSVKTSSKTTTTKMFSILPGFVVSPNVLIYGRLGVGNADVEVTKTTDVSSSTTNKDIGIYGLGVDYLMTSNLSVKGEANKLSANGGVDGTSFNVGVNYRF
jgi:opacity protein-like surface antigen